MFYCVAALENLIIYVITPGILNARDVNTQRTCGWQCGCFTSADVQRLGTEVIDGGPARWPFLLSAKQLQKQV